ncbi:hypothetical protein [Luteimonas sp. MC1828]|uniref:hypothetical protein n=1 Tax=Luteimonas sp. MC1828 TaxID=2799787 RepID=UPI0018F1B0BB|nr:hypothetical protein [Luteimonas sp. MC1828]MBJ7576259.1 hypothetical protein [Luteimonas sp. MC1828]
MVEIDAVTDKNVLIPAVLVPNDRFQGMAEYGVEQPTIHLSKLTPKLSRAAAGREAHGMLYLPCGLRPDAVSA